MQLAFQTLLIVTITMVDFIIILSMIFSEVEEHQQTYLLIGSMFGISIIIAISMMLASFTNLLPADWMLGLLGLIPFIDGIKRITHNDRKPPIDMLKRIRQSQDHKLIGTMGLITLAIGGDNFGVYITLFANKNVRQVLLVVVIMIILTFLANKMAKIIADNYHIKQWIHHQEIWMIPVALIGLGLFIMFDHGLFAQILRRLMGQ